MARQLPPWLIELQENRPQLFQDLPKYGSEEFKESGLGARFKGKFGNRQYKTFTDNIVNQRQAVIDAARPKRSEITTDVRGEDFTKLPVMPSLERTVTERVGRGSFKNIPEWRGLDDEWTRFDPIVDRSYSADDDVRNIPVSTQLNLYEESNRSEALANAAKTKGSQGDGNPTNSWSVQSLQKRGILNSNNTNKQIANTTNDVNVAGFNVGSFDKNTQETTKKSTINESPSKNSVRQNKQLLGSMDQLTLEATDYGANPDRAPLKSIKNPSGETNPGGNTNYQDLAKIDRSEMFNNPNADALKAGGKEGFNTGVEAGGLSEGGLSFGQKMKIAGAIAGLFKKKGSEGTGKPMDTNVNTDQLAWELDPSLRYYT